MEQMSCRRGRCCQKVSEQLGSQGFRQQFRQLFHFDQQFCFVAIFTVLSPKVFSCNLGGSNQMED